MTDQTELERLDAVATPGEWTWENEPPTLYAGRDNQHHGLNLLGRLEPDSNTPNNLNLICHLRNNAQKYIALEKEIAELREAITKHELDLWRTANVLEEWQDPGIRPFDGTIMELRKAAAELQQALKGE